MSQLLTLVKNLHFVTFSFKLNKTLQTAFKTRKSFDKYYRTKSLLDLIRLNYSNIITINGSIISLNYRCYVRKRICTVLMLWLYICIIVIDERQIE